MASQSFAQNQQIWATQGETAQAGASYRAHAGAGYRANRLVQGRFFQRWLSQRSTYTPIDREFNTATNYEHTRYPKYIGGFHSSHFSYSAFRLVTSDFAATAYTGHLGSRYLHLNRPKSARNFMVWHVRVPPPRSFACGNKPWPAKPSAMNDTDEERDE